jgi:hypothetical protein
MTDYIFMQRGQFDSTRPPPFGDRAVNPRSGQRAPVVRRRTPRDTNASSALARRRRIRPFDGVIDQGA